MPLTKAAHEQTLRRAEFGFLGVVVYTRVHTPRRCGVPFNAGVFYLSTLLRDTALADQLVDCRQLLLLL